MLKSPGITALLVAVPLALTSMHRAEAQPYRQGLQQLADQLKAQDEQRQQEVQEKATRFGLDIRKTLSDGREIELHRFEGDRPIYYITNNTNAAATVSADQLWPGGSLGLSLDGSGEILGIWDGGSVRTTHQEYSGRATSIDGASTSNHATHVGGTMIAAGVSATAKGMSFAATLRSYNWTSDATEMAAGQMLPQPISVSNHSYSWISGWIFDYQGNGEWWWFGDINQSTVEDDTFGFYSSAAANWDQLVVDSPNYLITKSAGNDRNDDGTSGEHWHWDGGWVKSTDFHPGDGSQGGYDTIAGGSGSAKNILTIGAVSDIPGGYQNPSQVVMSSFSGWGPTDDGRIKPDLVGNGISLRSSTSSSNSSYGNSSGTSMSSPNVAGALGQLTQHARDLFGDPLMASTMKALVIGTANEAGAADGPDYSFGWGLMDAAGSAELLTAQAANPYTGWISERTLSDGGTQTLIVDSDGSEPLRVTVAWTDPAGSPPPTSVDPTNLMLVNDLDLRVIGPGNVEYQPWVLDPANPGNAATTGDNFRDNVEQVVVDTPPAGRYRVRVTHKNNLSGGSQDFGLVVSGIVDAPEIEVELGTEDTGEYGYGYGSNQHPVVASFTFTSTGVDLDLGVTGFDIDGKTEVSVFVNDSLLGNLSPGPNNQLNTGDVFFIPASSLLPGENDVRFVQKTPGYRWGISELLLSDTEIELEIGTTDSNSYGKGFGDYYRREELIASFDSVGTDLDLSVTGFDIDGPTEVSVYLNNVFHGTLSPGVNNDLNGGDVFFIPLASLVPLGNQIKFVQKTPGYTWGVTDVLLDDPIVELVPGQVNTDSYGKGYGRYFREAEVVAAFDSIGTDLDLSVVGFDIDGPNEVSVYLNNTLLGKLSPGTNNGLNDGDVFFIPLASQSPTDNEIRFVEKTPGYTWGVTEMLVADTVRDIVVGVADTGSYGKGFGEYFREEQLTLRFDSVGTDLNLSTTGFDIDGPNEVSVFLNNNLLGHLSPGPDDALNNGDVFPIPLASQLPTDNEIRFVVRRVGNKWGVQDLLLE